jgi:Mn-containing catalase
LESPILQNGNGDGSAIHAESSELIDSEPIQDLLVDQLRDILHAEKQLLKALPKMAKAARSAQLQRLLETHLVETEGQVERLNESLRLLGTQARAKPCKGMAGLVEEGDEVMTEGKNKKDAPADLALIGAAQRVEHYEIAAYTTARNLALQLRQPAVVQLLTASLGEEQNAGQLLDQVAQPLMSVAKMPASVTYRDRPHAAAGKH